MLIVPTGTKNDYANKGWTSDYFKKGVYENAYLIADDQTMTYGSGAPAFTYTCYSIEPMAKAPNIICYNGTINHVGPTTPVGTYPLSINNKYEIFESGTVTFYEGKVTVTKAPLTVTAKSYTIYQGDPLPSFEATYSGFMNGETANVLTTQPAISCNATSASAPGTYPITVSGTSASNYSVTHVNGVLTIKEIIPQDQTIALSEIPSMAYGDGAYNLPEKTVEGLTLSWTSSNTSVATISGRVLTIKGAGTATITATQEGDRFYNPFSKEFTLNVAKAPLTIQVNDCERGEGDDNPEFTFTYSGFVNGDDASCLATQPTATTTATATSTVGTYPITVSGASSQNYEMTYVNGTLTVKSKDVYVCLLGNTLSFYDDIYKSSRSGAKYALSTGSYTPEWVTPNNQENVTRVVFDSSFACARPKSCYGWFFNFSNLTDISGLEHLNTSEVTDMHGMFAYCSRIQLLNVGNFDTGKVTDMEEMFEGCSSLLSLDVSLFNTANVTSMYAMFEGCATLGSLDVSGFNTEKVTNMDNMFSGCRRLTNLDLSGFDTSKTNTVYNILYNCSGLLSLTLSNKMSKLGTDACKGVGTASMPCQLNVPIDFNFGDIDTSGSYFQWKSGYFKAVYTSVVITANNYTIQYGDAIPALEYTSQGATLNGTPSLSCAATSSSPVGTYPITVSQGSVTNSNATYVDGTLTITKAPLTVTAKSYTITQGDPIPTFEADYEGFKNSENANVLTTQPTITCSATVSSTPGTYAIIVSGAEADNYEITYIAGSLTVNMGGTTPSDEVDDEGFRYINDFTYVKDISDCTSGTRSSFTNATQHLTLDNVLKANVFKVGQFYGRSEGQSWADMSVYGGKDATNKIGEFNFCWAWYSIQIGDGVFGFVDAYDNMEIGETKQGTAEDGTVYTFTLLDKAIENGDNKIVFCCDPPLYFGANNGYVGIDRFSNRVQMKYVKDVNDIGGNPEKTAYAILNDTTLTFYFDSSRGQREGTVFNVGGSTPEWYGNASISQVTHVVFDPSFIHFLPTSTNRWLCGMSKLESITGIENLNTSKVTNMDSMFSGCYSLTSIDLSHFDTSSCTYTGWMFYGCSNLKSLDMSHFDTSKVTDMGAMFYGCTSLTTVDLSPLNTSSCRTFELMFANCTSLTALDLSHLDTSSLSDTRNMMTNCTSLESLTLPASLSSLSSNACTDVGTEASPCELYVPDSFDFGSIDTSASAFQWKSGWFHRFSEPYVILSTDGKTLSFYSDNSKNVREGTVYELNTGSNLPGWYVADGFSSVTKVVFDASFDAVRPTSTFAWLVMNQLTTIEGLEYLHTDEVTNMGYMFWSCNNLATLDVTHFNTSKVRSMRFLFAGMESLTSLDVSHFDTSNVTDMMNMFQSCSKLTSLDVTLFDTSKVTGMRSMFLNCSLLTDLDVSGFVTDNVTNMSYMFMNCAALTSIDLSGFNTAKVTEMEYMFSGCNSLQSVDLSGFSTGLVRDMSYMFNNCKALTSLDLSSFNMDNVTNTVRMLNGCSSLANLTLSLGFSGISDDAYTYVGTEANPCKLNVPDSFDFGSIDTSASAFQWKSGWFSYDKDILLGDVNHDMMVTITDVMMTVNAVVSARPAGFYPENADMNGDHDINISDIMMIVKIVVGN